MQDLLRITSLGLLSLSTAVLAAEDNGPSRIELEDLDSNGDGVVSFVEFQEGDRDVLARIDTDQNGVLTIDEFLNARPTGGPRAGNPGGQRGGNGDASQINERRAQMREMMTERATARFHEMDTDGDEIVTLDEFQEANFNMMDRDDDGVLSKDELRRPRQGGPGPRGGGRGRPGGNSGGQSQQN